MKKNTIQRRNRNSWSSPETLKLVSNEIQNSPDNLRHAFKQIAMKMGVTEHSVSASWYAKVRDLLPQFATGSAKNVVVNRKNTPKKDNTLLHEKVLSTQRFDGIKVVTVKRYFAN